MDHCFKLLLSLNMLKQFYNEERGNTYLGTYVLIFSKKYKIKKKRIGFIVLSKFMLTIHVI